MKDRLDEILHKLGKDKVGQDYARQLISQRHENRNGSWASYVEKGFFKGQRRGFNTLAPLLLEAMEALELIKRPTPDRYKEVALGWRIEKTLETLTSINEKLEKIDGRD